MKHTLYLIIFLMVGLTTTAQKTDTKNTAPWQKVKTTTNIDDVEGLTYVAALKGQDLNATGRTFKERDAIAIEKIKRKAAAKGVRIVLIVSRKKEATRHTVLAKGYK